MSELIIQIQTLIQRLKISKNSEISDQILFKQKKEELLSGCSDILNLCHSSKEKITDLQKINNCENLTSRDDSSFEAKIDEILKEDVDLNPEMDIYFYEFLQTVENAIAKQKRDQEEQDHFLFKHEMICDKNFNSNEIQISSLPLPVCRCFDFKKHKNRYFKFSFSGKFRNIPKFVFQKFVDELNEPLKGNIVQYQEKYKITLETHIKQFFRECDQILKQKIHQQWQEIVKNKFEYWILLSMSKKKLTQTVGKLYRESSEKIIAKLVSLANNEEEF